MTKNAKEDLAVAPLLHSDGNHIMDSQGNTIAICATGWSDDVPTQAKLVKSYNMHDALMAVANAAEKLRSKDVRQSNADEWVALSDALSALESAKKGGGK